MKAPLNDPSGRGRAQRKTLFAAAGSRGNASATGPGGPKGGPKKPRTISETREMMGREIDLRAKKILVAESWAVALMEDLAG